MQNEAPSPPRPEIRVSKRLWDQAMVIEWIASRDETSVLAMLDARYADISGTVLRGHKSIYVAGEFHHAVPWTEREIALKHSLLGMESAMAYRERCRTGELESTGWCVPEGRPLAIPRADWFDDHENFASRWRDIVFVAEAVKALWPPQAGKGASVLSHQPDKRSSTDQAGFAPQAQNAPRETPAQRKARIQRQLAEWAPAWLKAEQDAGRLVSEKEFWTAAQEALKSDRVTRTMARAELDKHPNKLGRGKKANRRSKSPEI